MDDSALKVALRKLLDHGDAAEDSKLLKMAAAKKGPPIEAPCAECAKLEDGEKCEACASKEGGEDESELAGLLEAGAEG